MTVQSRTWSGSSERWAKPSTRTAKMRPLPAGAESRQRVAERHLVALEGGSRVVAAVPSHHGGDAGQHPRQRRLGQPDHMAAVQQPLRVRRLGRVAVDHGQIVRHAHEAQGVVDQVAGRGRRPWCRAASRFPGPAGRSPSAPGPARHRRRCPGGGTVPRSSSWPGCASVA